MSVVSVNGNVLDYIDDKKIRINLFSHVDTVKVSRNVTAASILHFSVSAL